MGKPKQRYISTTFWDDEWVQELNTLERFFYIYLLTNPLTDISGVYKITDKRIASDLDVDRDQVTDLWPRFEEKVYRYQEWVIIYAWPKHQKWQQMSKIKTGIDNSLLALPEEIFMLLSQVPYAYPIDSLSYPITDYTCTTNYPNPNPNPNPNSKDNSKEKEDKKESTIDSTEYLPQARHLSERIIENDAIYFKNKNFDATLLKWSRDIRLLATRDGRDIETIDKVIDWCQSSDFWRANILSGAKLRDKFPTLLQQMNSNGHKKQEAKRPFKHDFEGLTPEQKVAYYGKGGKL